MCFGASKVSLHFCSLSLLALTCRKPALDLLHVIRTGISLAGQGHTTALAQSPGVCERQQVARVAQVNGANSVLCVCGDESCSRTPISAFPKP